MAHVSPYKKEIVERLAKRFESSRVIGIANIRGIPAPQFQAIRRQLSGRATIAVVKNSLLRLALEQVKSKKDLTKLVDTIEGPTAVVTADINPFKLFKELEATKTRAPARGGEVAPEDIWVREGETPFKPGPVVGELQRVGIPAAIERGKVVIKKDKLLVKAGERIPRDVAQVLARLEIYPMVVGLDLRGVYEDGIVFRRDSLAIDEALLRAQVAQAGREALSLVLEIAYPTKDTVNLLLAKAQRQALGLAVEAGIPTKETLPLLLAKAQAQMLALASHVPAGADEELRSVLNASSGARRTSEPSAEERKAEKREVSEEEAASGLGSLFG